MNESILGAALWRRHGGLATHLGLILLLALVYFMTARVGLTLAVVGGAVSLVWPPSGIALVALLVFGRHLALGVALGSLLANGSVGVPLPAALGIAAGATLAALVGALLLERWAGFHPAMDRGCDVVCLILLGAVLSTAVSALIGVASLVAGGVVPISDYASTCIKWWLGDMMGVLVVAPPLLVLLGHARPTVRPLKALEAVGLLAAIAGISHLIFGAEELAGHGYYPAALAVLPFIVWAALRFDHWGASLATLAASMVAVWGTSQGTGPFAAVSPVDSLVRWSTFANLLAVTGLLLAASNAEARRAQTALRAAYEDLERRVGERTRDLADSNAHLRGEMTERRLLEAELIRVGDEQQKAIGRELHDGLGQHLTTIGLYGASLRHKLAAQGSPEVAEADRILALVKQASDMTRAVTRGLYPVALEHGGLPAALQELAENTRALRKMDCVLRVAPDTRIRDPLVAINLYRVAQEAINNALKYSQARHIWIDLSGALGVQQLAISDDGVGIDTETIGRCQGRGQGLGLHNLRHRATLLGGVCTIARNAHGGTTVAVSYPVAALT